jgi:hypothetical protein
VIDGANKQAVEEMRRRHHLDLTAAAKVGKSDFIEIMNAEFIQGRIQVEVERCSQGQQDKEVRGHGKVLETLSLADEYAGLIWDQRRLIGSGKREELPSCPNHLCDAALYAWRRCYQYLAKPPEAPLVPGSSEWYRAEADRMP